MQVKQQTWSIEKLVSNRAKINLNPSWQRGPAWQLPRQVLLIDSILRGMDIPKVYLRRLPTGNAHDAVDGQQRLRVIWEFKAGVFPLNYPEPLPTIDGFTVMGKKFDGLNKVLRDTSRWKHTPSFRLTCHWTMLSLTRKAIRDGVKPAPLTYNKSNLCRSWRRIAHFPVSECAGSNAFNFRRLQVEHREDRL